MKEQLWTQTIFESYNLTNNIIKTIDKRVLSLGINSYKTSNFGQNQTLELMEAVIELIEHKKKVLKLKALIENTLKNISLKSAKLIIRRFIDKQTLKQISTEIESTIGIARRKIKKAITEAYEHFCKCGYNIFNIEQEFGTEKWLVGVYQKKYQDLKQPKAEDNFVFTPQKSNSSFFVCFSI